MDSEDLETGGPPSAASPPGLPKEVPILEAAHLCYRREEDGLGRRDLAGWLSAAFETEVPRDVYWRLMDDLRGQLSARFKAPGLSLWEFGEDPGRFPPGDLVDVWAQFLSRLGYQF